MPDEDKVKKGFKKWPHCGIDSGYAMQGLLEALHRRVGFLPARKTPAQTLKMPGYEVCNYVERALRNKKFWEKANKCEDLRTNLENWLRSCK